MVTLLKIYLIFAVIVIILYAIRHLIFAFNRLFAEQKQYYGDIYPSVYPSISVLIPMYNEEKVLHNILDSLLACDYDADRLEIIPINDSSTDRTRELLDAYHRKHPLIKPLHRTSTLRGKPAGLNDAMALAQGEIILVFDADYRPARHMLKHLALAFLNPEVGAVMGRVIPYNANVNLLTRLLSLERAGGYQADQQARYNLGTLPQYGGTVGGFRKALVLESGGFNPAILAEDTELTFRLLVKGWKIVYANSAECYEEVPETWAVRSRQIRRWSRGHNSVAFRYLIPLLKAKGLRLREKVDGLFLLFVYAVPFIFVLSVVASVILFFLGEMNIISAWWVFLFIGATNAFGNFAPFYQISAALIIDGSANDARLLHLMIFNFYYYLWYISRGFIDAIFDVFSKRTVQWAKTERFNSEKRRVLR